VQPRTVRRIAGTSVLVLAGSLLVVALLPDAVPVDSGAVTRGPLRVTIDEEGKTRVRDVYVVSAPIPGRVLRIEADPGDPVEATVTLLARLVPSDPSLLDVRTLRQAEADVRSAQAALALAEAAVTKAEAELEYARADVERARELVRRQTLSQADLDRKERDLRTAAATLATARAQVKVEEAELENARARLIDPSMIERQEGVPGGIVRVLAPVSGRILRVLQESETVVTSGTPLLEIGNPADLEVVVEMLSAQAVRVDPGQPVIIEDWGGPRPLEGVVERVEPFGFTKISALGVEEQRVNVIVRLVSPPEQRGSLGHGFRVEARVVIWQADDVLRVPEAALFRDQDGWAVFRVVDGEARLQPVSIGQRGETAAELREGLAEGDRVVLYPSDRVADGVHVRARGS
jgi:HlyD family secretion protein